MSRGSPRLLYPFGQAAPAPAPIVPTDHDVLSGRGVNIAQHPGNERFRTLVNSRHDSNYCTQYSTSEKRAVAKEIMDHIKSLQPPGRFLKRAGRAKNSRGLEGPWEELSESDALKKTCQALRDCNRQDRTGYAATVEVPQDVKQSQEERERSGLSNKEHAAKAAAQDPNSSIDSAEWKGKRPPTEIDTSIPSESHDAPDWAKRQRLLPNESATTPTTAASTSGVLGETSLLDSGATADTSIHCRTDDDPGFLVHQNMPPSPAAGPFENLDLAEKLAAEIDPFASVAASTSLNHGNEPYDNHSFAGSDPGFAPSPFHEHHNYHNGEGAPHRFD